MKCKALLICLSMLLILILGVPVSPVLGAAAQPALPGGGTRADIPDAHSITCYALDVVFIVDQSGSMSGNTTPPSSPNDPNENRVYGPRYSLNWLANNRMGLCQNSVHRVSVISYGRSATVDLSMATITPSNQMDWDKARAGLEQQIQTQELGDTDPMQAFQAAAQLLSSTPPVNDGIPRKKAIILLTDGKACVVSLGCGVRADTMNHEAYNQSLQDFVMQNFPFSGALAQQDQSLRQAVANYGRLSDIPAAEYSQILAEHPVSAEDLNNSVYIWAVAMNSASDYLQTDGQTLEQITTTHGGQLIHLEENRISVPRTFNEILSWLAGVSPDILRCGPLAVSPYLAGAVLDVFKLGEGYEVKVGYQGKRISAGSGDTMFFGVSQYTQFGSIEHYTFKKPPAGLWDIQASDCEGIQASFIPFSARLIMQGPAQTLPLFNLNGQISDPKHPFKLQYRIVDQSNVVTLDQDPNYPLDITAVITDPAGKTHQRKLVFVSDGIWESSEALPVHLLGQYKVSVTGVAACVMSPQASRPDPSCQNGRFTVFSDSAGQYKVGSVMPFDFVITAPQPNAKLALHDGLFPGLLQELPVDVTVQMVDAEGRGIPAASVLSSNPAQAFTAQLEAGGKSSAILMTPDPANPSLFRAQFKQPAAEGPQTVKVNFKAEYPFDKFSPLRETASLKFTRADPLTHRSSFWLGVGGLGLLFLVALIVILLINDHNLVHGSIWLGDSPKQMTPIRLPLRRMAVIKNAPCGYEKVTVVNDGKVPGTKNRRIKEKQVVKAIFYPPKGQGSPIPMRLVDGDSPKLIRNGVLVKYYWGGR